MLLLLSLLASAQALSVDHGNSPTVLQYLLEVLLNEPESIRYLPDDIDIDKDGNLNENEVELKFKSYVKDVFDQLDKDMDKLITQEEFRNASINLDGINKIIDFAMQSYPIKTYFDFGDRNQDGFIAEDDFLIPENRDKLLQEYYKEKFGDKFPGKWYGNQDRDTKWTLKHSVPTFKENSWSDGKLMCAERFDVRVAQVFCREMGYKGVQSVSSISFDEYKRYEGRYASIDLFENIFQCHGTESKLEDCAKKVNNEARLYGWCPNRSKLLASVNCTLNKEIGKIELVGGKDASSGDLHIGLEKYCGSISPGMAKVVCTELGYGDLILSQAPLVTRSNFFTSRYGPPSINREFACNGSEQKLQDCPAVPSITKERTRNRCYRQYNGIICKPDLHMVENYASPYVGEADGDGGFYFLWEQLGRYVFVADLNGDHKVSLEELGIKIKEIVAAVFQVLDQTDDGVFSASDLTTLNVRLPDVTELARIFLQFLARGEPQIDLYTLKILFERELSEMDYNEDGVINLKDLSLFIDSSQVEGLLTILSRELDQNQDGIILTTEMDNYVKRVMDHLGGGTITLDTVWNLMKKSKFTCLQINGIRTFVEAVAETIETQSKKLLDYFFRELDLDGNGEIPVEELYNAHVPCDEVDSRRLPQNDSDRVGCRRLIDTFVYPDIPPKAPRLHRFHADGEEIANAFCMAMQPDF